jgi:hypothetical protein
MLRAKLVVFVAMALMLAQLPCIAACASHVCDTVSSASLPPCHRHHNHSRDRNPNCLHQAMVSSAISNQALHAELQPFSVGSRAVAPTTPVPSETWFREVPFSVASPPHIQSLSSVLLRI